MTAQAKPRVHCRCRPPVTSRAGQADETHFASPTPSAGFLSWGPPSISSRTARPLRSSALLHSCSASYFPCPAVSPTPIHTSVDFDLPSSATTLQVFDLQGPLPPPKQLQFPVSAAVLSSTRFYNGGETWQQAEPGAGDAASHGSPERLLRAARWHRPGSHHIRHLPIPRERRIGPPWHVRGTNYAANSPVQTRALAHKLSTTVSRRPCHTRLLRHSISEPDISESLTGQAGDGYLSRSVLLTGAGDDPRPQGRLRSVGAGEARRV